MNDAKTRTGFVTLGLPVILSLVIAAAGYHLARSAVSEVVHRTRSVAIEVDLQMNVTRWTFLSP